MDERKATIASNLIKLRLAAGMTQAELGEKLNYSDKSISKWERGDVTTDVFVLMQIAEIFGVDVDYLLKPHNEIEPVIYGKPDRSTYTTDMITLVAILGIWTLALFVFIILWICGMVVWQVFVYAVPVSLITLLVLRSVWQGGPGQPLHHRGAGAQRHRHGISDVPCAKFVAAVAAGHPLAAAGVSGGAYLQKRPQALKIQHSTGSRAVSIPVILLIESLPHAVGWLFRRRPVY